MLRGKTKLDDIFKQRIHELIKNSNTPYEVLAEELGFGAKSTISKYANGKITKIGPSGIAKLANYFGVSPCWLAGFSDEKYNAHKN